jgi:hypothetical protein
MRHLRLGLLAALIAMAAGAAPATAAAQDTALVNSQTGRCLDSNASGNAYTTSPCWPGDAYQHWTVFTIDSPGVVELRDDGTGRCLDSNATGDLYTTSPCGIDDSYEQWQWTSHSAGSIATVALMDAATGRCLDSDASGDAYTTNPCWPGDQYQHWAVSSWPSCLVNCSPPPPPPPPPSPSSPPPTPSGTPPPVPASGCSAASGPTRVTLYSGHRFRHNGQWLRLWGRVIAPSSSADLVIELQGRLVGERRWGWGPSTTTNACGSFSLRYHFTGSVLPVQRYLLRMIVREQGGLSHRLTSHPVRVQVRN